MLSSSSSLTCLASLLEHIKAATCFCSFLSYGILLCRCMKSDPDCPGAPPPPIHSQSYSPPPTSTVPHTLTRRPFCLHARLCHDEASDHRMDRYVVTEMVCMQCLHRQPVGSQCSACGCKLARYYCGICHLFDDEPGRDICKSAAHLRGCDL